MTRGGGRVGRRSRLVLLGFCVIAIACLGGVGSAAAEQFTPHVLKGTFEGPGETGDIAVDQGTGAVYVLSFEGAGVGLKLHKFDAQGVPSPFASLGSDTLTVTPTQAGASGVAVDNSSGPNKGRIYVTSYEAGKTWAFNPDGSAVGGKFPISDGGQAIGVDPVSGAFWLTSPHLLQHIVEFLPDGTETANSIYVAQGEAIGAEIDPQQHVYTFSYKGGLLEFTRTGTLVNATPYGNFGSPGVNQVNGNAIYVEPFGGRETDPRGNQLPDFAFEGNYGASVAVNGANGYLYASTGNHTVSIFEPGPTLTLPDVEGLPATNFEANSFHVHFEVNPDGVPTTGCEIQYGPTVAYGKTVPCEGGAVISGNSLVPVNATLTGLNQGATYHYRLVLTNGNPAPNNTIKSRDAVARPSAPPILGPVYANEVHSDSAVLHAEVTPEGAATTYHVLYGTADCASEPGACAASPESASIGAKLVPTTVGLKVTGLQAGTTYHYLFVFTNQSGSTTSAQGRLITFPQAPAFEDSCANAHVRQQTGAALLWDCRAYELVSAGETGGYDVESSLVAGQEPFGGYPLAENPPRVLYGVHDGGIPGTGNPTNHGVDPYVATRGETGWTTRYVGIPANLPYSTESFASPVAAADSSLETFAFGGPGLCSPCFADGSTGIPLRTPAGELSQGMAGPSNPGPPAAPTILVRKSLSADGRHLVFGSSAEFQAGAGSPAIYDRDLTTGITRAVSKLPGGGPIPCTLQCTGAGLAELDLSADGSRIVLGQLIGVNGAGKRLWHLYMNVGDSPTSIDLTPGATEGAVYDGMSSDGSKVYFVTADPLTGSDTDGGADLYRADVSPSGAALTDVSIGAGGSGNSDACSPTGNSVDEFWNDNEGEENCGVVAIGGGAGVAASSGSAYFLSPELLAGTSEPGDGVAGAPNLYESTPGSAPHFVATLESSLTGPNPPWLYHRYEGSLAHTKNPRFVAVDDTGGPSRGDVYVVDAAEQKIRKYNPAGNLVTGFGTGGTLERTFANTISGIAVGPTGTLYVAIHREINDGSPRVFELDENGVQVGQGAPDGAPFEIGISVDNEGWMYFLGYFQQIMRWKSGSGTQIISTGEYESGTKNAVAVNPVTSELYVAYGGETIGRFEFDSSGRVIEESGAPCEQRCEPTEKFGEGEIEGATGLVVEPGTGDLYVDEGNKILRFTGHGRLLPGPATGTETLSNSNAAAIGADGALYATSSGSSGAEVQKFSPLVLAPNPATDSPVVIDSVNEPETPHTADFEVTPSGNDAVFPSTIPFTGYDNAGHEQIMRFDAAAGAIACASCAPTNAVAASEASLAPDGLSVTDDGRVFFDSTDPLSPRDLDQRQDVYEFENGAVNLVTTGISPFDSGLLTVSENGTDVYFFTRDALAPQDQNGRLVKVYDARTGGGFSYVPPAASCKASDECHGAGAPTPAPPAINTVTGTRGNQVPLTCKKGFVKKHGKCTKKKKAKKKHGKHAGRHSTAAKSKKGGHR